MDGSNRAPCIIALAQRKGGVGKTTLAVSVAAELSGRGFDVGLVDADPQRSACEWARPGNLGFPVYEMPFDRDPVTAWARQARGMTGDCIVIDAPPADRAVGAAVAIADVLLVPCTPSGLDLESTEHTLAIVRAVRERRQAHLGVALVPNRVDSRTLEGRQVIDELRAFGETVAPPIGNRSAFVRAFSLGCSVSDLAPGEKADLEVRALADLVGRLAPHLQLPADAASNFA
ncbi:MAG: ParA family protein [Rhizobiales bacterium]|nr:ParA family protein [Hyphomicrobiales bacterium]